MINVTALVVDPDFAQNYTVYRETGAWGVGGKFIKTETSLPYYGAVYPVGEHEIVQVPEADRTSLMMCFCSVAEKPFYLSREASTSKLKDGKDGISDQIAWQGDRYKIVKIWPYLDFGYWMGVGAYLGSDTV